MHLVCSICGAEAAADSRMGSTSHYLACGCDRNGIWINDGRGGYWQPANGARIISLAEFLEKQK